jgi:hypothetical protein
VAVGPAAHQDALATRNRGATWTKLATLGLTDIANISFSSARDGVVALGPAVGLPTDVLVTTNGGKTWQPEVIDGAAANDRDNGFGSVLATPGHDYYADPASQNTSPESAVFASSDGGASPLASHLSISLGAKKLTAKALKAKHHNRVTVKGKLNPVTNESEIVLVSDRNPNSRSWNTNLVNVASNGAFQTTLKNIKSTTDVVVYALGDGVHGGAEGYARLTVTK